MRNVGGKLFMLLTCDKTGILACAHVYMYMCNRVGPPWNDVTVSMITSAHMTSWGLTHSPHGFCEADGLVDSR